MEIIKKEDYILYKSDIQGVNSAIFVGVHGDEICGIQAVKEITENLQIDSGSVLFVFANPNAIKANTRMTEFNLNRAFKNESEYDKETKKTYEYKRAQELKKYLDNVDVLLDIHSSFSEESEPFIICEKNANDIVKFFPKEFSKIAYGFDSKQPGGTDYYMNSLGKIGICIECGSHQNPNAGILAKKTTLQFLKIRGHIKGVPVLEGEKIDREYIQVTDLYYTKSDNFRLSKDFADFEGLSQGSIIGKDGEEDIISRKDSLILFARNREEIGQEGFLLAEIIITL
jgi:succinylglutamate desuccinylase